MVKLGKFIRTIKRKAKYSPVDQLAVIYGDEQVTWKTLISRINKLANALKDRGVKKAGFVVLIGAQMPSILVEVGFLSNPRGEKLLRNRYYHKIVAQAIYRGIKSYSNQQYVFSD